MPRDTEAQAAYTRILRTTGINWLSGHICAEYWNRGYRENASADFPDVPVPTSQLVALQNKLEQAKAQLERKATKPVKRKVSSLERKRFLAKRCSVISGSKKRQAPAERDLPTTKRSRKLSKRQLSTRLRASEEDKQLLTERPTNAQNMVKKLRTENLSLKVKLRNIEQTQQNAKKQNAAISSCSGKSGVVHWLQPEHEPMADRYH